LVATLHAMWKHRAGSREWLVLVALILSGAALGYWLTFEFSYHVSPTLRIHGFPIPVAIFQLESGGWVDFITPMPWLIAFLDLMFSALLATAPMAFRCWRYRRHQPEAPLCDGCGYNLTGNTSGRCPECGSSVPTAATLQSPP
jgi:hypothetical protein